MYTAVWWDPEISGCKSDIRRFLWCSETSDENPPAPGRNPESGYPEEDTYSAPAKFSPQASGSGCQIRTHFPGHGHPRRCGWPRSRKYPPAVAGSGTGSPPPAPPGRWAAPASRSSWFRHKRQSVLPASYTLSSLCFLSGENGGKLIFRFPVPGIRCSPPDMPKQSRKPHNPVSDRSAASSGSAPRRRDSIWPPWPWPDRWPCETRR